MRNIAYLSAKEETLLQSDRPVLFMGSSEKNLRDLPDAVIKVFARGLYQVSIGGTPDSSKSLKGFGGRRVLELIEDYRSDTYRAVYTVTYKEAVYVLHVFKKKSKRGIATPKKDIDLIQRRLKAAANHYEEHFGKPRVGRRR